MEKKKKKKKIKKRRKKKIKKRRKKKKNLSGAIQASARPAQLSGRRGRKPRHTAECHTAPFPPTTAYKLPALASVLCAALGVLPGASRIRHRSESHSPHYYFPRRIRRRHYALPSHGVQCCRRHTLNFPRVQRWRAPRRASDWEALYVGDGHRPRDELSLAPRFPLVYPCTAVQKEPKHLVSGCKEDDLAREGCQARRLVPTRR